MQRGDRLTLGIERPAVGGRMIARHDGAVVFVSGAIPGETVEAEVERVQRGIVWASTRRVLEPSPDRLHDTPDLDCGGCAFAHVSYTRQLALKAEMIEDGLRRIGRLTLAQPIEVVPSPIDGHRMRARLHLRQGQCGFFREGTHELCDPGQTRQLLPASLEALARLTAALGAADPTIAAEIELSENIAATERVCHLDVPPGVGRVSRLASLTPIEGLTGVSSVMSNESRTRELLGSPLVSDTIAVGSDTDLRSLTLVRHARAFFQGNRYLFEPMVRHVVTAVQQGLVLDLYAGVGPFSVAASIAGHGPVVAVEGDAISAANLRRNATQCAGDVRVRSESVEAFLSGHSGRPSPSTVIVDPPRTGLSKEALAGATALQAPRLIYVSCDVATLARDTKLLCESGYSVTSVRAFDFFPQTAHVETVIVFSH